MTTTGDVSSLRARLVAERARDEESRPSGTSDDELDRAIARVARADAALAEGQAQLAARELAELSYVVGDSWPHSDLGAAVLRASSTLEAPVRSTTSAPATGSHPEPWPAWVRYTLLAALVAVVGVGLVVVLRDTGFLPIAGPFVVLFLMPLLAPLRRRGLRHRARRRARRADAR